MKKRLISLLLAFSMMLTFLPAGAVSAFAEEKIDSSTETLIPNDYSDGVYHITEANTIYQMEGNYNFPIEITATGVTINIIGNITYGFEGYHDDGSKAISYLINVKPTGSVTINNDANYNVTTSKSGCGFVTTRGARTAQNPNASAGSATINGGSYTTVGKETLCNSQGEMMLKNVTAECQNGFAVTNRAGTVIIDGGNYKSINRTAIDNERSGTMTIQGNPEVVAQNDAALYSVSGVVTVVSGTFKDSAKGIDLEGGSVVLKDAEFSGNRADIYLNTGKQITIEKTFNHNATIDCADPKDGLQLTTATTGEYQKNLNLTSANEDYLVGYKTEDGKEYRCLSKKVGATVSDPEGEVKAGDPAKFTVTLTHENSTGTGILTFGNKNSEIEYKDENDEYKPVPEGGLKINLGNGETEHEFRIAPKETGKQTLTAAVKQDKKELATDEKDFVVSEMPILTLKDGVITSVTVPGKNGADPEDITEIVKKNANEDGSFHVPEGATVSVAFDKDAFADSGLKFGHWDITGLDDPNAYQDKESFAFEMPAKAVTLKAMTQDASIEDDGPGVLGTVAIVGTAAVGTAVLGYQAYSLGAEFAGKLMALPYFPSNRSALAMMLWEDAGKPMPESELLYPDVGQEERDMDLQHAARWAMENELIPDLNDEGTAPEEMKFYPDNAVSKIDVLNAWQKAQELKQNA